MHSFIKYFLFRYLIFYFYFILFLDEKTNKIDYLLVLEYADSGTLRQYLKKNFKDTFKWEDQLKFAREIASAISYLHYNEIIHRDLVSFLNFIICQIIL